VQGDIPDITENNENRTRKRSISSDDSDLENVQILSLKSQEKYVPRHNLKRKCNDGNKTQRIGQELLLNTSIEMPLPAYIVTVFNKLKIEFTNDLILPKTKTEIY
jgi:hypothetical protein